MEIDPHEKAGPVRGRLSYIPKRRDRIRSLRCALLLRARLGRGEVGARRHAAIPLTRRDVFPGTRTERVPAGVSWVQLAGAAGVTVADLRRARGRPCEPGEVREDVTVQGGHRIRLALLLLEAVDDSRSQASGVHPIACIGEMLQLQMPQLVQDAVHTLGHPQVEI